MIDNNTHVSLHIVHDDDRRTMEWDGSFGSFVSDNDISRAEAEGIRRALDSRGEAYMGGGASPLFRLAVGGETK